MVGKGAVCAVPTIYCWTAILNGGHAEPVIGRAFARPGGFAHRSARRHCERSEAIQNRAKGLDCFVAALLAMTTAALLHHLGDCLAASRGVGIAAEIPG